MHSPPGYYEALGQRDELRNRANRLRQAHYGNIITASRNYFVPLIKYCRNNCLYCGFSRTGGEDQDFRQMIAGKNDYLAHLERASAAGCREILLVLGDKPEKRYRHVFEFLEHNEFSSYLEYVYWASKKAIEKGLEPHVNVGVLSRAEWEHLKPVVASAGLMLETSSKRLLDKGNAHYNSPDKHPEKRLESIRAAMDLEIPFTTGLLVGIGETGDERLETLYMLRDLAEESEYLQEIIIQGFHPLPNSPWKSREKVSDGLILDTIAATRLLLPDRVSVQFPPNLGSFDLIKGIYAGANDLGGVSPVTIDHVNHTHPWPSWDNLVTNLDQHGLKLRERGPVYGRLL